MTNQRFILALLGGCVLFILALGLWLRDPGGSADPSRAATLLPVATPTPTAGVAAAPPGHRLAGTVVGDVRYAVVEFPDGTNDLYRPGQDVPGLGRLVEVESNHAIFEGDNGRLDLRLVAAPTTTPVLLLRDTPRAEAVTPAPPPPPSPSASGSSSSTAPGRSAS